ncbi:hypothetical protein [Bacillus sp. T3]|uniref:hypothetical protein n=1 Tax=Bacillus sp. T3 TaxID=467262 RepID=UPI00298158EC|nr:hypothetical protein [Bacillus sp. T3]
MFLYEMIYNILEEKGALSIPSICQELNEKTNHHQEQEKLVLPAHIKSAISRKKDLFKVEENVVSIDPEKNIQALTVHIGGIIEPSITIKIDFNKNRFIIFEWNHESQACNNPGIQPTRTCGEMDAFKKELFRIKPWEWSANYHQEQMILDGIFWSIKLVTEGKVYESEGLHCFPKEWGKLCNSLTKLTGLNLKKQLSV